MCEIIKPQDIRVFNIHFFKLSILWIRWFISNFNIVSKVVEIKIINKRQRLLF
jgi:hypothetical protein